MSPVTHSEPGLPMLRLRPQEIWERGYLGATEGANAANCTNSFQALNLRRVSQRLLNSFFFELPK